MKDYYKIDHTHCWSSKNPPCGQKIEHLKCCLCEETNPKIIPRSKLLEKIGMLRQWLNEDKITEPKEMITNEDIKHWLDL